MEHWKKYAERMVEEQIVGRGLRDERTLSAMRGVPRHLFVPEPLVEDSYIDRPLPIGDCQTISQPFMVARMTQLLDVAPGMKILEIGTGSGYQSAVLAYLGAFVWSIERVDELAERARKNIKAAGFEETVKIIFSDGVNGYPEAAPYDRIIVTAAVPEVLPVWYEQLANGGLLVAPVNVSEKSQRLLARKKLDNAEDMWDEYCRFVPLLNGIEYRGE